ncbi:MAG: hypothetical protein ACYCTL_13030 [Acidimicrobiales bacterium]
MSRRLREIAPAFVLAPPGGARVRTRLQVADNDAAVLMAIGTHLVSLAGGDLAERCREGWLGCPVVFTHRGDEVASQVAIGAVRYDITLGSGKGRWYLDASWKCPAEETPSLDQLHRHRVLAVDPAYTSMWGAEHWLGSLQEISADASGHHAAALVIARRGLRQRALQRKRCDSTPAEHGEESCPSGPTVSGNRQSCPSSE